MKTMLMILVAWLLILMCARIATDIYDYWFTVEIIEVPYGQREVSR